MVMVPLRCPLPQMRAGWGLGVRSYCSGAAPLDDPVGALEPSPLPWALVDVVVGTQDTSIRTCIDFSLIRLAVYDSSVVFSTGTGTCCTTLFPLYVQYIASIHMRSRVLTPSPSSSFAPSALGKRFISLGACTWLNPKRRFGRRQFREYNQSCIRKLSRPTV